VTGKDVTLLLLGPQWGEAGEILRIFSVGIGIHILYNCNLWLHMSLGKTDRLVRWSLLSSILICVSFFGGLAYGAVGIATAYTICMHLLIWPALSYAGKPIGLKFQSIVKKTWRFYFAALTGALICAVFSVSKLYVIGIYEELNVVGRLITAGIFYVGIYLGVVILLFGGVRHIKGFVNIVNDVLPKRAAL
jgi:PST family polysaccharide transporter